MRKMVWAAAAAALLAACGQGEAGAASPTATPAQADASARPQQKTFRDWTAVCDNGLACVAYGRAAEGATGWARVGYGPGPQGELDLTVGFWPQIADDVKGDIAIDIDGRTFTARPIAEDQIGHRVADPMSAARLLAQGRRMTLSAGGETVTISLDGAAAALLWLDERQGRLGGQTALVRTGPAPASAVPAPPALPRVVAGPAVDQGAWTPPSDPEAEAFPILLLGAIAALPAIAECRENLSFNPEAFDHNLSAARLSGGKELWLVPCGLGAYNVVTRQYLTDAGGANPRVLRLSGSGSDPATAADADADLDLVNAGYDPETRSLSHFSKGRGLGDCGLAGTWVWTGETFVLTDERSMSDCIGMPAELWPTTWRSRE